jgi:hypothetical protein
LRILELKRAAIQAQLCSTLNLRAFILNFLSLNVMDTQEDIPVFQKKKDRKRHTHKKTGGA